MSQEKGRLRRAGEALWHKIGYIAAVVALIVMFCYYTNTFGVGTYVNTNWPTVAGFFNMVSAMFMGNPFVQTYILGLPWIVLWAFLFGAFMAWKGYVIFVIGIRRLGYRQTMDELSTQPSGFTTPSTAAPRSDPTPPPRPVEQVQES
jgi:hypothetical protein